MKVSLWDRTILWWPRTSKEQNLNITISWLRRSRKWQEANLKLWSEGFPATEKQIPCSPTITIQVAHKSTAGRLRPTRVLKLLFKDLMPSSNDFSSYFLYLNNLIIYHCVRGWKSRCQTTFCRRLLHLCQEFLEYWRRMLDLSISIPASDRCTSISKFCQYADPKSYRNPCHQ